MSAHRAPGVPAVLALVQALGFDGEPALRAVGVVAGGAQALTDVPAETRWWWR